MDIPISVGSGTRKGKVVATKKLERAVDPFQISAARFGTSDDERDSIDVLREVRNRIKHSKISFKVGNFGVPLPKRVNGTQPDIRRLFVTHSFEGRTSNGFSATAEGKVIDLP